jgi:hypothetical protein
MADLGHVFPADVGWLERTSIGSERDGVEVTEYITGRTLSRDSATYDRINYNINPSLFESDSTLVKEWEIFWKNINGGADVGYITEPLSVFHQELVCGAITDGTKTAFELPINYPTLPQIYVNKIPALSSEYSIFPVANLLLGDGSVDPDDAADWTSGNATDALQTGFGVLGQNSLKVTPDGGSSETFTYGVSATRPTLAAGAEYTAMAAVFETKSTPRTFRVGIRCYDLLGIYLATVWQTGYTTATYGAWTMLEASAITTVANTVSGAIVVAEENNATTDVFYLDAFGIAPGTYNRVFIPSLAPGLIVFDTAPAANKRVTATATGKRLTRCRFNPGNAWSYSSVGHATVQAIQAKEVLEY